ncbi:MAG: hypothetical protein SV775_01385, partial [Thermodesulfobacteriota bacterium]|nr:hypothetical protein [Thermodesulfobacteriota bacterium]
EALRREKEEQERQEALRREKEEQERQEALRREKEEQERQEALRREKEEQERQEALRREKEEQERQEALRREKEEQERQEALRREKEEQERQEALRREKEEQERQKALHKQKLERLLKPTKRIRDLLRRYEGQPIGINYDDTAEIKKAELVRVNEDHFSIFIADSELVYSYPLSSIMSIVEGVNGVPNGALGADESTFSIVIRVYHLVS